MGTRKQKRIPHVGCIKPAKSCPKECMYSWETLATECIIAVTHLSQIEDKCVTPWKLQIERR